MTEPTYPSAWTVADASSLRGQRLHLRLLQLELAMLVAAAVAGLVLDDQAARVTAAGAFGLAIVLRAYRMSERPDRNWHGGRAAAESIKTLCWRYAVAAHPFGIDLDAEEVDGLFVERMRDVLAQITALDVAPSTAAEPGQITSWMRSTRSLPLDDRKATFASHRLVEQQRWYATKATYCLTRNRRWSLAVLVFECCGVALALSGLVGVLGVIATLGSGAAAWMQARQYGALATNYTIAYQELDAIRSLMDHQTQEDDWAVFVDSAEGAISREHTMWRASRSASA